MKELKLAAGTVLYGDLDPARDAGLLCRALRTGCLGIAGLLLTEESVTDWPPELRAHIGKLLQSFHVVFAADEQTVEWGPHYGITPRLGEHPGWTWREYNSWEGPRYCAQDYTKAVCFALTGQPFYLRIHPRDGQADSKAGRPDNHHLLHRFAGRYGVSSERIAYGGSAAFDGLEGPTVTPERVTRAQAEAQAMLDEISARAAPSAPVEALDELLDGKQSKSEPAPSGRRRILPGTVFDPSTHYTADYYDGTGIEYMQPDGTWRVYHGTGLRWGGNELVSKFIREIGESFGKRLLDYGCSAGDFASHMHRSGWEVRGFDISQPAIDRAPPDVRPLLTTQLKALRDLIGTSGFDHVTAFDLLEHIWSKDVPEILGLMSRYLRPGGLLWANICTCGEGEQTCMFEPGVKFSLENGWALISGHTTLQRAWFWRKHLRSAGYKMRDDLAHLWQTRRAENPAFMQGSPSWSSRNFLVAERA